MAVGNGSEAGFLQDAVDALVEFPGVAALDAKAGGSLDGLIDREFVVSDRELGNVAVLPWFPVALLREVASFPPEGASGLGIEAGDGFQQSGLAAAGGADDGHEVPPWGSEAGGGHQVDRCAVFLDGETNLLEFVHAELGSEWLWMEPGVKPAGAGAGDGGAAAFTLC